MNIIRENLARYVYSGSSRRRSSSALCRRDSSGTGAVAVRDVTARSRLVCRFDGESRGGDARCSRSSSDEDDESSYAGTGVRGGRRRSGADADGGGDEATDRAETRGDVANRGGSAVDVGSAVGAGSVAARRNANAGFGSFIPAGSSDAGPGAVGGFRRPASAEAARQQTVEPTHAAVALDPVRRRRPVLILLPSRLRAHRVLRRGFRTAALVARRSAPRRPKIRLERLPPAQPRLHDRHRRLPRARSHGVRVRVYVRVRVRGPRAPPERRRSSFVLLEVIPSREGARVRATRLPGAGGSRRSHHAFASRGESHLVRRGSVGDDTEETLVRLAPAELRLRRAEDGASTKEDGDDAAEDADASARSARYHPTCCVRRVILAWTSSWAMGMLEAYTP